jgi:hypothetical protein
VRRLLPLALLAAAACIDDLEPQYRVTNLRILAVRAEVTTPDGPSADVAPGDTLRLEALVAHPGLPDPDVRWFACAPTGTDAVVPRCLEESVLRDPASLTDLAANPFASGVHAIGAGAAPAPLPLEDFREAFDAALAAVDALAAAQPTYQCRLYAEIPIVVVADQREVAVKRVRLTRANAEPDPDYVRNVNPAIADVLRASQEGCPVDIDPPPVDEAPFPAGRTFLCGRSAGDPQTYNVCGPDGARTNTSEESLDWQWYVTGGEFPEVGGVGNATGSTPEFEAPDVPFTLWVILRDGRGGVAWDVYPDLAVAP